MKTLTWSWLETVELKNVGPKRKGRQLITALKKTNVLLTKQTTKNTFELVKKKKTVELLIVDEEGLI